MTNLPYGIQSVISILSSKAPSGKRVFPPNITLQNNIRISDHENTHEWFKRCANFLDPPEKCFISDHIALFAEVVWNKGKITRLVMQSFISTACNIDEFYMDDQDSDCLYLRLDMDFRVLGPLFKEPLPHIHINQNGEPRFAMIPSRHKSPITGFLEFLLLNFEYEIWEKWARQIYSDKNTTQESVFDVLVAAYNASKSAVLEEKYKSHIKKLKENLAIEWNKAGNKLPPIPKHASLLSY